MSTKKYPITPKTYSGTKQKLILFFCIALLFICAPSAHAQDLIFFKNGTKDTVKVLEIGTQYITYKKTFHPTGPKYKVYAADVVLIEFADGTVEVIKTQPIAVQENRNHPRNVFMGNVLGLMAGNIHLGYESISADGYFGLRVNLAATVYDVFDFSIATTGVDFNFYPKGQTKTRYFVGPSFRVGIVDYDDPYAAILINNGVAYDATDDLYIGGQLGLGVGIDEWGVIPYGFLMFNMGMKF